jgi:hypothetical protein
MSNSEASQNYIQKIEKFFGGLKLAVIIILIFAAYLTVGTFVESYYGAEYAGRAIYKSWPFMIVQFLIFISVFMAALLRFPMKKRLYGFYTIHLGIIILLMGSFVTYYAGVDANLNLTPNSPSSTLIYSEDVLEMEWIGTGKKVTYQLPPASSETAIDETYDEIALGTYLPYAKNVFSWKKSEKILPKSATHFQQSAKYFIQNNFIGEEIILSLHPESKDYSSSTRLGPLTVHLLPESMFECIDKASKYGYLLWNSKEGVCRSIEDAGIEIHTTKTGKSFFAFKEGNEIYTFIPDVTSSALDKNLEEMTDAPYRVLNLKMFSEGRHLLLFGKAMAYKDKDKWTKKRLELNEISELPWMGFKLSLKEYSKTEVPFLTPVFTKPIQEGGKIIEGELKALQVKNGDSLQWLSNSSPIALNTKSGKVKLELTKKTKRLPFQLTLNEFKMDTDPGTNNPASYQSTITLFDSETSEKHKVFMNNPLKYKGFTFYQASYFQVSPGVFGSVLSVNYDPGRPIKYLGSLLLVFGAIWHYFIRKRRKLE